MFKIKLFFALLFIFHQVNANASVGVGMTGGTESGMRLDDINYPNQGTLLDNAQNGVQIVNIAAPDSHGISRNHFSDFNVSEKGVIINNSLDAGVSTLGGTMYWNPNLQQGNNLGTAANTILMEVSGTGRTNINGYVEIFGQKADLIIANPNGISVAGGGFLNLSKLSLVAGSASEDANGNISFNTNNGNNIAITGINSLGQSGLYGNYTNYVSLIARSIEIIKEIVAQNKLQMISGNNTLLYGYGTTDTTVTASDQTQTGTKPLFAFDAYNLGSIVANSIVIIATETGVGSRFAPEMFATDSITITSEGNIQYNKLIATNNINITSSVGINSYGVSTDSSGNKTWASSNNAIASSDNINFVSNNTSSTGSIINTGSISGRLSLNIAGNNGSITNSGTISGISSVNLNQNTGSIINSGTIISNASINLNANNGAITNSGTISGSSSTLTANSVSVTGGSIFGNGSVNITAVNGAITNSGTIYTNGFINLISTNGAITNNLSIIGLGTINLTANNNAITNNSSIYTNGSINLISTNGEITNNSTIYGIGSVTLTANNAGIVNNGTISSNASVVISGNSVLTQRISAQNSITITSTGDIRYNRLVATNNINVTGANIFNWGNNTDANGNFTWGTQNSTTNINYRDSQGVTRTATNLPSQNNSIAFANNINFTANSGSVVNSGLIFGNVSVNLSANNITNQYATIESSGSINIGSLNTTTNAWGKNNNFTNYTGYVNATGNLNIWSNTLLNTRNTAVNTFNGTNNGIGGASQCGPFGQGSAICRAYDGVENYQELQDPRKSYLLSNNNININSNTLTNIGSLIAAINNINIVSNTVNNSGINLVNNRIGYYWVWVVVGNQGFPTYRDNYDWRERQTGYTFSNYLPSYISAGNSLNSNSTITNSSANIFVTKDVFGIYISNSNGPTAFSGGGQNYNNIVNQNPYGITLFTDQRSTLINILNTVDTIGTFNTTNLLNAIYINYLTTTRTAIYAQDGIYRNMNKFLISYYLWSRFGISFYTPELRGKLVTQDQYFDTSQMSQKQLEPTSHHIFSSDRVYDQNEIKEISQSSFLATTEPIYLTAGAMMTPDYQSAIKSDAILYEPIKIKKEDGSIGPGFQTNNYLVEATRQSLTKASSSDIDKNIFTNYSKRITK